MAISLLIQSLKSLKSVSQYMRDAMNIMHNSSTVAYVVSSCLYLLRVYHNRRGLNISHFEIYFVKLYGKVGSC
jgi:hypothetical protein